METVIGIDIGGTNFRIGAADRDGTIYNFQRKPSADIFIGNAVDDLYREITSYMINNTCGEVVAVTIGIPSIVSKDKKTIYSTPNLKGFENINITDPLSEKLGLPVYVDRDVNYLLQNDIEVLSLDKSKLTAGFYIGTGFGNAIYWDGKFFTGKNGVAGELGHIPLYGVDEVCTCGNHACAETRCSGKYLEQLAEKYFPDTMVRDVFKKHGDSDVIKDYVRGLAIPIATEINILDPDYIIIAGGVVIMEAFPRQILTDVIHFYTRKPYPEKNLEILFTEHTQQSGVAGGAKFAFDKM